MGDLEWFGFEGHLGDEERAFLAVLRERTEEWAKPWCRREDLREDGALIVGLDVDAPEVALLTVGMHLAGNRIRGDRLDHQLFTLPDPPTSLAIEATGSAADLAVHAAGWLGSILRRPIVRYEWQHSGRVYASRYLFADTGEGLVETYDRRLAPPGQREQLIAAGHSRGEGWLST
jgi:hypothetical protein